MRINSDHGAQPLSESDRASAQSTHTAGGGQTSSVLGQDLAQFSGSHAQVQALAAQVTQLPEIRTERVTALRQAVLSGNYDPGTQEVAQAVFSHLIVEQAA